VSLLTGIRIINTNNGVKVGKIKIKLGDYINVENIWSTEDIIHATPKAIEHNHWINLVDVQNMIKKINK